MQESPKKRQTDYPIESIIANRWSPRSMSGEMISDAELHALFEAARWAPSSYNGQPWRFLFVKRTSKEWGKFFDLLIDFNKSWVDKASVLMVVISRKTFEHNGKPSDTHSFDTGAAWQNFALEGFAKGLVVHGMQGFDYEKTYQVLNIPKDSYQVEAMVAIGKKGKKEDLPTQALKDRELPSDRNPQSHFVMENNFKAT